MFRPTVFAIFLAIIFFSGCTLLNQQTDTTKNDTTMIPQPHTKLTGCDYQNPPCEKNSECIKNQCVSTLTPPALVGCQYNNPSCETNQQCIQNHCISPISLDAYCPVEDRIDVTTLDGSNIAYLPPGKCILFDTGERNYSIRFVSVISTNPDQYEMEIVDSFGNHYQNQIIPLKYFRLGRDLTISAVLQVQDYRTLKLYPHRVIPNDQLQINANCENLTSAELCNQFKINTKNYIKAMEQASNISLGECFDSVTYNFVSDITHGYSHTDGEKGLITAGTFANSIFTSYNYESHEPMHLLYFCANIPNEDNLNHAYWFASEEQFRRDYGDATAGDESLNNNQYWENQITSNPSMIDTETGQIGGCWGAKTHILNEKYISLSASERADFLKSFYQRIKTNSRITSWDDKQATIQIICDLTQEPGCYEYLRSKC